MGINQSKASKSTSPDGKMAKKTWYQIDQSTTTKSRPRTRRLPTKRPAAGLCGRYVHNPSLCLDDLSTLLFLTGSRPYCVEKSPKDLELAKQIVATEERPAATAQPTAEQASPTTTPLTSETPPPLTNEEKHQLTNTILDPYKECVSYQGCHEYGYHVVNLFSTRLPNMTNAERVAEKFTKEGGEEDYAKIMDELLSYIPETINAMVKNEPFVLVYRDPNEKLGCFFPRFRSYTGWAEKLFKSLNERFTDQLKNIVLYRLVSDRPIWKPSHVNVGSVEVESKLKIAYNPAKMAKALGFPGNIKSEITS